MNPSVQPTSFSGLKGMLLIVRRSLRQHAVSTSITTLSAALACGLVIAVFAIKTESYEAFTGGSIGFDAVLGARGSQLQLVLNTVFHLETSPGNISYELYQAIKADPSVALAIPYAVGDNYHGFRIVGTTDEIFTKFEYQKGKTFTPQPGGRIFDLTRREAVVGDFAARKTGLRVGSKFNPSHGLNYDPNAPPHEEEYVVVGILEPTNSPSDRVIWIPMEGIYRMSNHVLRSSGGDYVAKPGEAIPDAKKEVSAVMLKLKSPQAGMALDQTVNKQGKVATLAWPISRVMAELFDKIGWMNRILAFVAYLVIVVAAGSILASLYNTINERRRDLAILRALGARKGTIFSLIVLESTAISAVGAILGYVVYAAILSVAAKIIRAQTGIVIDVFAFHPVLILAPAAMIALGALAGVIPAIKAYSTDVASNLAPVS